MVMDVVAYVPISHPLACLLTSPLLAESANLRSGKKNLKILFLVSKL